LAFFFTAKCTKKILFKLRRSLFWTSILFGARVVFQGYKVMLRLGSTSLTNHRSPTVAQHRRYQ
ncbi:MAG: hypothetical protein Q8M62_07070, partial [Algoriphagus sp.]|uniref:hypothetical protein n=1 Tax=Algoriphagus sp. TaxID=1872435 RepID=UPI0027327590